MSEKKKAKNFHYPLAYRIFSVLLVALIINSYHNLLYNFNYLSGGTSVVIGPTNLLGQIAGIRLDIPFSLYIIFFLVLYLLFSEEDGKKSKKDEDEEDLDEDGSESGSSNSGGSEDWGSDDDEKKLTEKEKKELENKINTALSFLVSSLKFFKDTNNIGDNAVKQEYLERLEKTKENLVFVVKNLKKYLKELRGVQLPEDFEKTLKRKNALISRNITALSDYIRSRGSIDNNVKDFVINDLESLITTLVGSSNR